MHHLGHEQHGILARGRKRLAGAAAADQRVQNLSKILRDLPLHDGAAADPKFRSAGSVSRKTSDIVTARDGYHGVATKGGQLTHEVVADFTERPVEMLSAAQALYAGVASTELVRIPAQEGETASGREGQLLRRWALYRERSKLLRDRKIKAVREEGIPLSCEVCSFDFSVAFGELGDGYIEVHHRLPLHISGVTETRIADLALLCANCHRMCHRSFLGESWRTPDLLRRQMRKSLQSPPH